MRQFVAEKPLDSKGCLTVEGKKFRYLSGVLRVQCGDMVYVRLLDGTLQAMTVAKIDERLKVITLQAAGDIGDSSPLTENHASPALSLKGPELYLFQFIAKPPKMELIIRQAVECGVKKIIPVIGEFCQSGPIESAKKKCGDKSNDDRWQRIINEARQQSGSPVDTVVGECVTVKEACELWKRLSGEEKLPALVLYEQTAGTLPMHRALSDSGDVKAAALAVGAEGGISPDEIKIMQENGFVPVHFETNILRCETAALYGIAVMQTALVENKLWQYKE